MAKHPKDLSKTPRPFALEDPRGDVLADVLGIALVRNALYKRIECKAPWGIRKGPKPRATFYLLARGSALLEVEGERDVTLSVGDVAFIPHGTPHVLRDAKTSVPVLACDGPARPSSGTRRVGGNGAPSSIIAGFFERELGRAPVLLANLPQLVVIRPADASNEPWIGATVQLILAESAAPGPASAFILQRLSDVLFVHALRSLSRRPNGPSGLPALSDPVIYQALSLMHADFAAKWTVAEIARRVGLSRSGFASRFSELVGEPPLQYLARWRLARAAELLRDTEDGIVEIALRVGYESVPSFSRTFKRFRGQSPGAYRRATRSPD
ncbi:MAG: AraC family transcriptional regulator [Polyangiaceae bacterium]